MKGLESDTTGYYFLYLAGTNPRNAEAVLRAAEKQAPSRQPWAGMISLLFNTEAGETRRSSRGGQNRQAGKIPNDANLALIPSGLPLKLRDADHE
jgi:hypothetical protein